MSRRKTQCSQPDCISPAHGNSLCQKHYRRTQRNGDPTIVRKAGRPKKQLGS